MRRHIGHCNKSSPREGTAVSSFSWNSMLVVSNLFSLITRARLRTRGGTASRACDWSSAPMMAHPQWVPASQPQSKFQKIALGVDQLDQFETFLARMRRLDQITIHLSSFARPGLSKMHSREFQVCVTNAVTYSRPFHEFHRFLLRVTLR